MTHIRIHQVHKTLGSGPKATHALKGVSLEAEAGEFIAISGKSGSGKTTFLDALSGLISVNSGSITVDGIRVDTASEKDLLRLRREVVGVVHQSDLIIPELTAAENVQLVLSAAGYEATEARTAAESLLKQVGLERLETRYPDELSRGQCQRVGIARALSGKRSVLLADEPSAALDEQNSRSVFALFQKLASEGTTIITASHDPIVLEYCTRSFTLIDGLLHNDQEAEKSLG